jgi:protein-disulfide isomerase/tRNA A-37 threonylcarbamoyl transferase component Bud32
MAALTALSPGKYFAKDYRVVRPLVEGAESAVYVVEQQSAGRERALKIMQPSLAGDPASRERFINEARIGAKIASEHVVQVIAAGVDDETGMPWIAMELLEGETLADLADRKGRLPPAEVADIVAQIGHALAAAHRAGIVHGDLTPENVFLARTHRADAISTVKILNFGVAAAAAKSAHQSSRSSQWSAPEQRDRGGKTTPATDVWALGLITFRLLTGRAYWKAANDVESTQAALLREQTSESLQPASLRAAVLEVPGTLPLGFDGWFSRCVTRSPSDRFTSGDEAVKSLVPLLKSVAWFGAQSQAPSTGVARPGEWGARPPAPPPGQPPAPAPMPPPAGAFPGWGPPPQNNSFAQAPGLHGGAPTKPGGLPGWFFAMLAIGLVIFMGFGAGAIFFLARRSQPVAVGASPLGSPAAAGAFKDTDSPIPVSSDDPVWGAREAPVTIVLFSDFECPFCKRLEQGAIEDLKQRYGPDKLRIVRKDFPLAFHKNARPAALAGETVLRLGGSSAYWRFHAKALDNQRELSPESYALWAEEAGVDRRQFEATVSSPEIAAKVDEDMELGKKVGVKGTPGSFVNGVFLSGAQPVAKFAEIIDRELTAAESAKRAGTPPDRLYVNRSAQNFVKPAGSAAAAAPSKDQDNTTVWHVPVGKSPVRGPETALVTIVYWSDFECPFCAKVEPVLADVAKAYGDKVRFVWKDNPLAFHRRANPAAQMAREARAQKGDAGFWQAHDLLFEKRKDGTGSEWLEDDQLVVYARSLGLDAQRVAEAIRGKKHTAVIEADQALADDLEAKGTPAFFINGRRLTGAQPLEKFKAMIDEEIVKAEALLRKGVPAAEIYATLIAEGKQPGGLEKKTVDPPSAQSPWKGSLNASVTVQIFGDLQCPFCKRFATSTLGEIEGAYGDRVRIVWRHLPLPMHPDAALAAEAAQEIWTQKGKAAFWSYADKLYAAQGTTGGLSRAALERYAEEVGADLARFNAALDARTHKAFVESEAQAASRAGITGTPGFMINGYFVAGAQPMAKFRRVIDQALQESGRVEK